MPEVRTIKIEPPARYLAHCPVPAPTGTTIAYLAEEYTVDLQAAMARCNAQLACARAWVAGEVTDECRPDKW